MKKEDLMALHKMTKEYGALLKRIRGLLRFDDECVLLTAKEFFESFSDREYEYLTRQGIETEYRVVETNIDGVTYRAFLEHGIVQEVAV